MITIISGTNRPNSRTELVSTHVYDLIGKYTDDEVNLLNLSTMDPGFVHSSMYSPDHQHPQLTQVQDAMMIPADKWIMVVPEYNGSYAGMVKLLIDAVSIRKKEETFRGKKLGLIGVASGRAGNLRGLDHLTTALNYMGMVVYPNRLPISQIHNQLEGDKLNESTTNAVQAFLEGFASF